MPSVFSFGEVRHLPSPCAPWTKKLRPGSQLEILTDKSDTGDLEGLQARFKEVIEKKRKATNCDHATKKREEIAPIGQEFLKLPLFEETISDSKVRSVLKSLGDFERASEKIYLICMRHA